MLDQLDTANGLSHAAGRAAPNAGRFVVDTGDVFLGSGHYMNTHAGLMIATGQVAATTRTWTVTWFGGYHGGVYIILSDSDDLAVASGQTPMQRYGVDGTLIGQHDRTDTWTAQIDPSEAARVANFHVFQTWAPDNFQTILDAWVTSGKKVVDLVTEVGSIAKVFTGKPSA